MLQVWSIKVKGVSFPSFFPFYIFRVRDSKMDSFIVFKIDGEENREKAKKEADKRGYFSIVEKEKFYTLESFWHGLFIKNQYKPRHLLGGDRGSSLSQLNYDYLICYQIERSINSDKELQQELHELEDYGIETILYTPQKI